MPKPAAIIVYHLSFSLSHPMIIDRRLPWRVTCSSVQWLWTWGFAVKSTAALSIYRVSSDRSFLITTATSDPRQTWCRASRALCRVSQSVGSPGLTHIMHSLIESIYDLTFNWWARQFRWPQLRLSGHLINQCRGLRRHRDCLTQPWFFVKLSCRSQKCIW